MKIIRPYSWKECSLWYFVGRDTYSWNLRELESRFPQKQNSSKGKKQFLMANPDYEFQSKTPIDSCALLHCIEQMQSFNMFTSSFHLLHSYLDGLHQQPIVLYLWRYINSWTPWNTIDFQHQHEYGSSVLLGCILQRENFLIWTFQWHSSSSSSNNNNNNNLPRIGTHGLERVN